ncbi:MAG: sigma-70 family RNA polymerase sigma factor [Rhodobacteraceae bacterium]|nr:sigma-70 family RNA polymerase sigma factor [Paracoccaceae bacterium]
MLDYATKPENPGAFPRESRYSRQDKSANSRSESKKLKAAETSETNWSKLILRVRDTRDEQAFALLFRHFAPRIKGFLMKAGAQDASADEYTQEVMATVWHKAHLFDPARASAATWIFTIARNKRIDALRRSGRPEPEELPWGPEPQPEAADALALQQDTERLAEALESLPDKQREIVKRAFYGDLTHSELAIETGLPLGTIKSRIRLALERLRHAMS